MANDGFEEAVALLPQPLQEVLMRVPSSIRDRVQEIRLRNNAPITLSLPNSDYIVSNALCKVNDLSNAFENLCDYSVHAHQNELRQGYIHTKNGCRAGVAGTAVVENGEVVSVRNVTSICLRIAREHGGCAKGIAFTVVNGGKLHGLLLCGEPASGKTSLLRDLVRILTIGEVDRPFRLTVVDERGELSRGTPLPCEVLVGYPKAVGIEQALRTLSPEGIVFDELGSAAEVAAVVRSLNSGVAAIASLHADSVEALRRRVVARQALQSGAFEYVALLAGRQQPGQIAKVLSAKEVLA